jgi:hypothetical protein
VLYNLSVFICSLRYPARNALEPYCHLCPAPLYNIFPHYLLKGTFSGGGGGGSSLQLLCETFLIVIRIERDMIKKIYNDLDVKHAVFLFDYNKTLIFSTNLYSIIKFN